MAWTKKQISDAKEMYKRKGNRLSWAECIAKATKGGKRPSLSGKKKAPAKKVVKVKRVTVNRHPVNVNLRIAGTTGVATSELVRVQRDIETHQRALDGAKGKVLSGMGAAEKRALRQEIASRKLYIQKLKKHRTAVKGLIK